MWEIVIFYLVFFFFANYTLKIYYFDNEYKAITIYYFIFNELIFESTDTDV